MLATAALAALTLVASAARAEDKTPIGIMANTPWVVAADEPEAGQRALTDVQRDWYKVFGHRPIVLRQPPAAWNGPLVYLGTKGPWLKKLQQEPLPGPQYFEAVNPSDALVGVHALACFLPGYLPQEAR